MDAAGRPGADGPAYAEIRQSAPDTARAQLGEERFAELLRRGLALPLTEALAVAKGDATAVEAVLGGADGGAVDGADAKPLTRREKEIAVLVADGLVNREIAERLFLSRRTVESHVEHIFTKLGLSSRTQLAGWVLERGGAGSSSELERGHRPDHPAINIHQELAAVPSRPSPSVYRRTAKSPHVRRCGAPLACPAAARRAHDRAARGRPGDVRPGREPRPAGGGGRHTRADPPHLGR